MISLKTEYDSSTPLVFLTLTYLGQPLGPVIASVITIAGLGYQDFGDEKQYLLAPIGISLLAYLIPLALSILFFTTGA